MDLGLINLRHLQEKWQTMSSYDRGELFKNMILEVKNKNIEN